MNCSTRILMATSKNVKRRSYSSERRAAGALETRRAILGAAGALFISKGYAGVKVSDIAARAGVSIDTVYASIGTKLAVFRLLLETAISGSDSAIDAEERDYVQAVRAATTAQRKLEIYADAISKIAPRLAPLYLVLGHGSSVDKQLAAQWKEISGRRYRNMKMLARDLRDAGGLRTDLSDDEAAAIVWSMNGPEYYTMLVTERGWSLTRFRSWLYEAWCRLLLEPSPAPGSDDVF
jgi:AcrR family transcriptional regulator